MIIIKRILPFVLLLLLVLITSRFLFFSGYLKIQKSIFRKEITSLSMKEVFVIKMTNNKLYKNIEGYEWKEKNKELVINGIYHEVISLKKNNGYSYISVIEDKAENQLFKRFFSTNKQSVVTNIYTCQRFWFNCMGTKIGQRLSKERSCA
jgi:L-rhamnose mutarotase